MHQWYGGKIVSFSSCLLSVNSNMILFLINKFEQIAIFRFPPSPNQPIRGTRVVGVKNVGTFFFLNGKGVGVVIVKTLR